jgi:hypothetical protein
MESPINTKVSQYKSDHLDEKSLDLKIAQWFDWGIST